MSNPFRTAGPISSSDIGRLANAGALSEVRLVVVTTNKSTATHSQIVALCAVDGIVLLLHRTEITLADQVISPPPPIVKKKPHPTLTIVLGSTCSNSMGTLHDGEYSKGGIS